jgi:hypothetical protein
MSNWALILATIVTAIGTGVIAFATWRVWRVYETMSKQIDKQITLTRDIFLDSHAPALSVCFDKCVYSKNDARLDGVIVIKNHGKVAAREIDLRITFGGTNMGKSISRVAIQPGNELTYPFTLPMAAQGYENSRTQGNRLESYVYGSYKGLEVLATSIMKKRSFTLNWRNSFLSGWNSSHVETRRDDDPDPAPTCQASTRRSKCPLTRSSRPDAHTSLKQARKLAPRAVFFTQKMRPDRIPPVYQRSTLALVFQNLL